MMIFMLAAAMTLAMLIATIVSLHQEAQRIHVENKQQHVQRHRLI